MLYHNNDNNTIFMGSNVVNNYGRSFHVIMFLILDLSDESIGTDIGFIICFLSKFNKHLVVKFSVFDKYMIMNRNGFTVSEQ